MQVIRRIDLSGGFIGDDDWTNPANAVPAAVRRLKATTTKMKFALLGKASTLDDAAGDDIGSMTFNAFLGLELDGQIVRGSSVAEVGGSELSTRVIFLEEDVEPGQVYVLNLANLTAVGAAALWVYLVSGANPL